MAERVWVFNPLKDWRKGDSPHDPIVVLVLSQSLGEVDGFPKLTGTLASDSEIDFEIKRLKEDLDRAGTDAKRTLREQRAKIHTALRDN
jgi:hypothetical protein